MNHGEKSYPTPIYGFNMQHSHLLCLKLDGAQTRRGWRKRALVGVGRTSFTDSFYVPGSLAFKEHGFVSPSIHPRASIGPVRNRIIRNRMSLSSIPYHRDFSLPVSPNAPDFF